MSDDSDPIEEKVFLITTTHILIFTHFNYFSLKKIC